MLTIIIAVVTLAMLLLVLGATVRFSIMSSWRTRGARDRLRHPDAAGVERACGFPPPADLVQMYREGDLTGRVEFSLVDKTQHPNKTWVFGGFYPLTKHDVLEQRRIHGITTGIPIADDMDKGVYLATREGRIMFRPGGRKAEETEVAPSAQRLSHFDIVGTGHPSGAD